MRPLLLPSEMSLPRRQQLRQAAGDLNVDMVSSRSWFRSGETPLVVFCRFPDCWHTYYLVASAIPTTCPGCSRQSNALETWWTITRPEGKPTKGTISANDRRFLKSIRIQPWEGGIDT